MRNIGRFPCPTAVSDAGRKVARPSAQGELRSRIECRYLSIDSSDVFLDLPPIDFDRRDLFIASSDAKFLTPDLSIDRAEVSIDLRPIDFNRRDLDIARSDVKFLTPDRSIDRRDLLIEVAEVVIDG